MNSDLSDCFGNWETYRKLDRLAVTSGEKHFWSQVPSMMGLLSLFCFTAPAILAGALLLSFSLISQRRFSAMGKGRGVSSYTHTKSQCNHYANQHNPNNAAYRANQNNHANQCNPNNPNYAGRQISSGLNAKNKK